MKTQQTCISINTHWSDDFVDNCFKSSLLFNKTFTLKTEETNCSFDLSYSLGQWFPKWGTCIPRGRWAILILVFILIFYKILFFKFKLKKTKSGFFLTIYLGKNFSCPCSYCMDTLSNKHFYVLPNWHVFVLVGKIRTHTHTHTVHFLYTVYGSQTGVYLGANTLTKMCIHTPYKNHSHYVDATSSFKHGSGCDIYCNCATTQVGASR